ncbi:MAG TPA: hypothetical protein VGB45_15675 [Abditibacterium sp.]|jgi:hypothetical protein
MNLLLKYRILLGGFIVGLLLSGITAFPLTFELHLMHGWLEPHRETFPSLFEWISRVRTGLVETDAKYPFIAYGTDWLAFAHLMIAAAYIGPFRDPIRNRFILEWGMFCCVAVVPLAFICGPIRGIPLGWTLVDCAFGIVGFPPLWFCWKWSKRMELEVKSSF